MNFYPNKQISKLYNIVVLKLEKWGWRNVLAVRGTGGASRGPGVCSQHPHAGSQPFVTPVLGTLMPPSGPQVHTCTNKYKDEHSYT